MLWIDNEMTNSDRCERFVEFIIILVCNSMSVVFLLIDPRLTHSYQCSPASFILHLVVFFIGNPLVCVSVIPTFLFYYIFQLFCSSYCSNTSSSSRLKCCAEIRESRWNKLSRYPIYCLDEWISIRSVWWQHYKAAKCKPFTKINFRVIKIRIKPHFMCSGTLNCLATMSIISSIVFAVFL